MTQKAVIHTNNRGITEISLSEELPHGEELQVSICPSSGVVDIESNFGSVSLSVQDSRILAQAILDATDDMQ